MGEVEAQLHSFLTAHWMEVNGWHYALTALSPGKNPGTHWTGVWLCPRADVDVGEEENKLLPMSGLEHRTIQSVA